MATLWSTKCRVLFFRSNWTIIQDSRCLDIIISRIYSIYRKKQLHKRWNSRNNHWALKNGHKLFAKNTLCSWNILKKISLDTRISMWSGLFSKFWGYSLMPLISNYLQRKFLCWCTEMYRFCLRCYIYTENFRKNQCDAMLSYRFQILRRNLNLCSRKFYTLSMNLFIKFVLVHSIES